MPIYVMYHCEKCPARQPMTMYKENMHKSVKEFLVPPLGWSVTKHIPPRLYCPECTVQNKVK